MLRYSYKFPSSFASDAGTLLLIETNNVNIYKTSHIIMIFKSYLSMQCFLIERNVANVYSAKHVKCPKISIPITYAHKIKTCKLCQYVYVYHIAMH